MSYENLENRITDALERFDPDEPDDSPDEWLADFASESNDRRTEQNVAEMRSVSRRLLRTNPYALGAVEIRVNFVVGKGHRYRAVPVTPSDEDRAKAVQEILDNFLERNRWHDRQQEIMRRNDRDGESFLRFFTDEKNRPVVRFVEPEQVARSDADLSDHESFGVIADSFDAERIVGYRIDGEFINASCIQHRKRNVDAAAKRGTPLLWPVRKNLWRAEKLLRNMSVVAEIQSAIALIRNTPTPPPNRSAATSKINTFPNPPSRPIISASLPEP